MRTSSLRAALLVGVASGLIGWGFGSGVRAQDPSPPSAWSGAVDAYAAAVNAWDLGALQACTTPEFHARLAAIPSPGQCRLDAQGMVQNGARLRSDYVVVQVLCRHPDGVEEFVTVTAKQTAAGWRVSGGFAPR